MTPSLEAMAREAGAFQPGPSRNYWAVTEPALAAFAALVRAQAMEDAALAVDNVRWAGSAGSYALSVAATAIRAKSNAEVATCKPAD